MKVIPIMSKVHVGETPMWKRTTPFIQMDEEIVRPSRNGMGYPTGLADLLVVMSYYVGKILKTKSDAHFKFATEEDCWVYVKETLFSMIYTFNQPTRSSQSCFTNISIFDDYFLDALCSDYKFIEDDKIVLIDKAVVKRVQELFLDAMNETLRRTPCTFPVTTACFTLDDDNNILDKDFVDFIAEKNEEFAFINIYSGKSSTLSSCCFDGQQMVVVKDHSDSEFQYVTLEQLYRNRNSLGDGFRIFNNGRLSRGRVTALDVKNRVMVEFITVDGRQVKCTNDHMFCVYEPELYTHAVKAAVDLRVGDKLFCRYVGDAQSRYLFNDSFVGDEVIDGCVYVEIADIKYYPFTGTVYCFEMEDQDDPFFTLENGIYTHNCRLRSDSTNEYFNSFGSGSTKIGSLGVVTLNMPRLAYTSSSEDEFYINLKNTVRDIAYINNAKRNIIKHRIELGAYSLYSLGFVELQRQYSTCGVNGLNECCEEMGYDILTEDGQAFVLRCLDVINKTNDEMQKRYKSPHNAEQTPSESSAIKLVVKDRYLGFKPKTEFYSNQFIPLTTKADMLDRIRLQGLFDKHFSGGAICHLNLGEKISKETMADLIVSCAKMGVIYWAANYQLNRCCDGHMSVGTIDTCPVCGKAIEDKYLRIVGFITNVKNWNKTRRELDFPIRQFYKGVA